MFQFILPFLMYVYLFIISQFIFVSTMAIVHLFSQIMLEQRRRLGSGDLEKFSKKKRQGVDLFTIGSIIESNCCHLLNKRSAL